MRIGQRASSADKGTCHESLTTPLRSQRWREWFDKAAPWPSYRHHGMCVLTHIIINFFKILLFHAMKIWWPLLMSLYKGLHKQLSFSTWLQRLKGLLSGMLTKNTSRRLERCTGAKNLFCSCRGLKFASQHLCGKVYNPFLTPASGT